jgi:predicted nucleic acid-binding protein
MTLVDTSVWIDHLRKRDARLVALLDDDQVLVHPWVRGELALGNIADRPRFLRLLDCLPRVKPAKDEGVCELIESAKLYGRGIGWVDASLLASCLERHCFFWTKDLRLARVAAELGVRGG